MIAFESDVSFGFATTVSLRKPGFLTFVPTAVFQTNHFLVSPKSHLIRGSVRDARPIGFHGANGRVLTGVVSAATSVQMIHVAADVPVDDGARGFVFGF